MPKYFGKIGFATFNTTSPGVYEEAITERSYYGDIIRITRNYQNSSNINENIRVSSEISIIADVFACENYSFIRFAEINGVKWKVSGVSFQHPRIVLTIGELYNEQTP